ncbi:sterol transporter [Sporobolomyces salmoneus]|uniref:sterol transporter n=1 Tax=Sporobolomyces salmoneus TaxID=183962 RepID=UPI00316C37EA
MLRSTALLLLTSILALASPLLEPRGLNTEQVVLDGVSWGANKLSQIGTKDGQVGTLTKWDWTDCGSPSDALQIDSIKITPDPPKPGQDLTIVASGRAQSKIDVGTYADVTVKLGLIKLLTKTFDVCEELDNANATLRCPIAPGTHTITQTVALPREIPRAKFQVDALVYTQDEEPAACINLWINFLVPDLQED